MKNKLINNLQKFLPQFKVIEKEKSKLMIFLSFLLFFNKSFMKTFATTIGYNCYLSNEFKDDFDTLTVIAHEYRHAKDYSKFKFLFYITYLFPQILVLLIFLFPLLKLWSLLFLVFLLPLPAYGRMKLELNGYIMSLFAYTLVFKHLKLDNIAERQLSLINNFEKHFTNSSYYFMWPFGVRKHLILAMNKINSEEIFNETTYIEVKNAFQLTFEE